MRHKGMTFCKLLVLLVLALLLTGCAQQPQAPFDGVIATSDVVFNLDFSALNTTYTSTLIVPEGKEIDILLAFPGLLLAITIVAVLGPGSVNTVIAITIFTIPGLTRMVRSVVLSLKSSEYVEACKTMGESNLRIIFTHVIPNSMSQIIVNVTLSLGTAILTASSLSFLGLGVTPPEAEWGAMLSQMREVIRTYPTGVLVPGIAITLVVMSFSLVGDGLRDALDPKLKNN